MGVPAVSLKSLDVLGAVVLGEMLTILWYLPSWSYSRYRRRYLWMAIICNFILVCLLKHTAKKHLKSMSMEQTLYLSLELFVVHVCLEAPHTVRGWRTFVIFFYHALHKLALTFVMLCTLDYLKAYSTW